MLLREEKEGPTSKWKGKGGKESEGEGKGKGREGLLLREGMVSEGKNEGMEKGGKGRMWRKWRIR